MPKINPFNPSSPVRPGMFAGRLKEIQRLENALLQTRSGNPTNTLVVGERGIGKSSLLFYLKAVADGSIPLAGVPLLRFLVIDTDIDEGVTQLGLVRKIEMALRHQLATTEPARAFLSSAWSFLQRLEMAGVAVKDGAISQLEEETLEEFSYSLARTAERLCANEGETVFSAAYDGLLIIIDEADNAAAALHLGSFLKLLLERLHRRGCDKVMVALAGLPGIRQVLTDSHASSLRLFEELELERLSPDDARWVIGLGLKKATELNSGIAFSAKEEAQDLLIALSEGFPHFLQQFCYSAFALDTDNVIDRDDVSKGAFGKYGAMELIGNRYYRHDFYDRIKEESYRHVLRIMADHLDSWVSKKDIRKRFKGNTATLDSAIYALRKRHIIIPKEGARGFYKLQNRGFAFWIKVYTSSPGEFGLPEVASQPATSPLAAPQE